MGMKVLLSGASGTIGSRLSQELAKEGNEVVKLVRRPAKSSDELYWNPDTQEIKGTLEGFDAVINLAGAPIAKGRWTDSTKKTLKDSRTNTASLLSETIAHLKNPPKTFISASAVGFYGDRGNEVLTEESKKGSGFLSDLSAMWEGASQRYTYAKTRQVNVRLGNVLSPKGGILKALAPIFKLGGGSPVGSGQQYMSWISEADAVNGIKFVLKHPELKRAVNLTSSNPVTNREFSNALGKSLKRPVCPIATPGFMIKVAMGQKGEELILNSTRAIPQKLQHSGFTFQHATVQEALNQYAMEASKKADDIAKAICVVGGTSGVMLGLLFCTLKNNVHSRTQGYA
jgi:uncharacterized protein